MIQSAAIARNTAVQTVLKIASIALGWVIVLMMTRSLGAEGFGVYTIITAYLQFFGVALDFGFVLVSSQLLAEHPDDQERVFANLLTFRLVTAAAVLAVAPLAIWFFPYSTQVKGGVAVLTLSFFLAALMQVFTGYFQKELAMGRVLIGEIVSRLVLIGFIMAAIASGSGLSLVLVGVVIGALGNFLVLYGSAAQQLVIRLAIDTKLWLLMWHRSWPLMTTIILNLIYLKTDTVILSLTRSEAEVGVYGAMYRVFEVMITFPTMFAGLLLPILAGAKARGDQETFQQTIIQGWRVLIFAAVPMVVAIFFLAPAGVALFGQDFVADGPRLLRVLVLANAAVFMGTYLAHVVVAAGEQKKMIAPFGATAAIGLIGYLIFIPRFGADAAAWMTLVAEATIALLAYAVARRVTKVSLPFIKPLGLALVASIPMALALWLGDGAPIISLVVAASLLYIATLYFLGGIPKEFFKYFNLAAP